jgi:hypothetical protein
MEMSCRFGVLVALRSRDTVPCIFFIEAEVCRLRNLVDSTVKACCTEGDHWKSREGVRKWRPISASNFSCLPIQPNQFLSVHNSLLKAECSSDMSVSAYRLQHLAIRTVTAVKTSELTPTSRFIFRDQ